MDLSPSASAHHHPRPLACSPHTKSPACACTMIGDYYNPPPTRPHSIHAASPPPAPAPSHRHYNNLNALRSVVGDDDKKKQNKNRYVDETPLPPPAARRLAEREAAERKRDDWLEVNIHKTWAENPQTQRASGVAVGGGGGGGDGAGVGGASGGMFGRVTGREKVTDYILRSIHYDDNDACGSDLFTA